MMLVFELPFEVLVRIASLLSLEDKLSCTAVCKAWKPLFQESLWDTLYIQNERKLIDICYSTASHNCIYPENGSRVKEIYMSKGLLPSIEEIMVIQRMFHNTDLLYAPLRVLGSPDIQKFTESYSWKSLTCLEIIIDGFDSPVERIPSFIKATAYLPCLTRLEFVKNYTESSLIYTINDIEDLHSNLPHLKYLSLNGGVSDITTNNMIIFSHIIPAKCLTVAKLDLESMDIVWLYYSMCKYSNIKSLHWNISKSLIAQDDFIDYINIQIKKIPNPLKYMNTLVIKDTWCNEETYEYLYKLISYHKPPISHIKYSKCITYHTENELYLLSDNIRNLVGAFSQSLQKIEITTNANFSDINTIMKELGSCPDLVELHLSLSNTLIDIDVLLNHCVGLKKLKLSGKRVFISSDVPENTTPHGLCLLEVSRTIANTNLFYYISFRCRHLKYMHLNYMNVFGTFTKSTRGIVINMPHTHLQLLLLNCVSFCTEHGSEYSNEGAVNLMTSMKPRIIVRQTNLMTRLQHSDASYQKSDQEKKVQLQIYWTPIKQRDALKEVLSRRREPLYSHEYSKLLDIQPTNSRRKSSCFFYRAQMIFKFLVNPRPFKESVLFNCGSIRKYAMDNDIDKEETKWNKLYKTVF
ncbi:hypothetical protein J3Q64DRAFT_1715693 [Phycomyces blakesleeanus]|uniref:F-box domain-containing protein n=1 Tax=Phycomyces blakesleeanus TaxID=4837 RepID=A0ABR3BGB2_PHYBL